MDPITVAIIEALNVNAQNRITGVGKKSLVGAYETLKEAIQKKTHMAESVIESIENLEQKPESKALQEVVVEEIAAARLFDDTELVEIAQELLVSLERMHQGQIALSKYNVSVKNSQVGVIGDHAHIEGGIH